MKKLLLTIGICLCTVGMAVGQSVGDIAFVGFNPDGEDDFAIVVLSDLPSVDIYFTDDEWNGTALNGSEGTLTWSTGGTVSAGTIVTFTDVDSPSNGSFGVSTGSLSSSGSFNLSGSGDGLWAYIGSSGSPSTFLAAIANEDDEFNGTDGTTSGTGLTLGTHALDLSQGSGTPDGGVYSGVRQAIDKSGFLTLVSDLSNNWTILGSTGDGETQLPFSTTSFEFTNTREITGNAGWRMLSFPVEDGSADDISDDTAIQGVAGGDNTGATSNFQTYDNSGAFETPTNVSTAIGNGYGFITYFYDNTDAGSSELPITLDISGTEPSSDVSVTLNTSTTFMSSNFTMVGNPFASNLDLNSITVTGGSIQNNVAFWNDGTSSYSAQDRTGPYIVAPWQGFWVESTDGAGSITIPTSGKSTSAATGTFFSKENTDRGDLNFTLTSENTYDEAIRLSVRPNATLGYDLDDASKFTPLTDTFATMALVGNLNGEDKMQSVFSVPSKLEEEITIPMELTMHNASGEFTFAWNNMETMPEGWDFELVDYETGETVLLRDESSYTFTVEEAASKENRSVLHVASTMESTEDSPRFGLKVVPSTSVSNEPTDKPLAFGLEQNYPNPFNPSTTIKYSVGEAGPVSITVYNVMGQKVAELLNTTRSAGEYQVTWNADNQASGIYYYRLTAPGQVITRQMTLIK